MKISKHHPYEKAERVHCEPGFSEEFHGEFIHRELSLYQYKSLFRYTDKPMSFAKANGASGSQATP